MRPNSREGSTSGTSDASATGVARLSIIHVVAPGHYGGLETVVALLATSQRRAGHTVSVAFLGVESPMASHPLAMALTEQGVAVESAPRRRFGILRDRVWMQSLCRRLAVQVLHSHGSRPDVVVGTLSRRLGIPRVATAHGVTVQGFKSWVLHSLQWRALRRFDAVVAVSRPLVAVLASKGIRRDRVVLIPNAFSASGNTLDRAAARAALGIDGERPVLGWVGRLSPEKGADVLIDALATLSTPRPMVVIVGDGQERESLIKRSESLGLTNDVRFAGAIQNAARIYTAFDGFVLSSRSEGTPMCLFEAMETGIPLVVTKVGGVPDVVSEREALVVPPEDPGLLAAAIDALLGDRGAAEARAAAARHRLHSEFDLARWLTRHDDLYTRLVANNRPRPRASDE